MAEIINNTITHLRLPFEFDQTQLLRDYHALSNGAWTPHFNRDGYQGNWNAIALLAKQDAPSTMLVVDPTEELKPTEALTQSPYFQEILGTLKCTILSARILRLEVGSSIKPHRDYNLGYEDGCFRLHIPIITNPRVEFMVGGHRLSMLPGECWYTNVNHIHSVANYGDQDRIHLVIDGARNHWSDELFFSLAPEEAFFAAPTTRYTAEELIRTIEELERIDAVQHAELIAQLRKELEELG